MHVVQIEKTRQVEEKARIAVHYNEIKDVRRRHSDL